MKKSTHRGFRGPNNFLLARPIFSSRNRTSFFDAESTDADASIDRGARKRSKTVEKIIAFPKSLPNKIDASRFSGPEQFFAGAPYISLQKSNVVFSTPNRSMPMPRSIALLEKITTTVQFYSISLPFLSRFFFLAFFPSFFFLFFFSFSISALGRSLSAR